MKVVLMHGQDVSPDDKWYPWFIKELQNKNIEIIAPTLPKPSDPIMDEWLAEINKTSPDNDTILIGHSRGGVAIMRWLEGLNEDARVKKVILLATNSGLIEDIAVTSESNFGFYTEKGYDFKEIKKHCDDFVVMHSEDDEWVPFAAGEKNAKGLKAKFVKFKDKGHFGHKTPEVPALLKEVIS